MIFAIEKSMNCTEWLAKIGEVEQLGEKYDLLRLILCGSHGRHTAIVLDEDIAVRHLERAVGEYEDPAEIVGKDVVVILDRLGDPVTFHAPQPYHYDKDRLAPPPPCVKAFPNTGEVWSEIGPGPKFTP